MTRMETFSPFSGRRLWLADHEPDAEYLLYTFRRAFFLISTSWFLQADDSSSPFDMVNSMPTAAKLTRRDEPP